MKKELLEIQDEHNKGYKVYAELTACEIPSTHKQLIITSETISDGKIDHIDRKLNIILDKYALEKLKNLLS